MTLKELLTGALLQLDRGTDAQTLESWRDKLTRYLNDAMIDLTGELQPRRSDTLALASGELDLKQLPRSVVKVIALSREGTRLPFYYGVSTDLLRVPAVSDGDVLVTYRYMPEPLKVDTDVPDLPEWCHGAMIGYAVGRERASGDSASIAAARACFELYNAAKRMMRAHRGELDAYAIENR
ncbi:MAG: hypothetical protein GX417_07270 [Clostridiales bacterium]|nr:hypothetical protein [Clostridiales bacterium]